MSIVHEVVVGRALCASLSLLVLWLHMARDLVIVGTDMILIPLLYVHGYINTKEGEAGRRHTESPWMDRTGI
jgi:hypothetical protein